MCLYIMLQERSVEYVGKLMQHKLLRVSEANEVLLAVIYGSRRRHSNSSKNF